MLWGGDKWVWRRPYPVATVDEREREMLLAIYRNAKTIATVGASATPGKPAHQIPRYMHAQGYRVIPITPRAGTLFDEPTRASLADLDAPPDVVDVFRPPEDALAVANAAIAAGARVLWFQPDTESAEAIRTAREAGLTVVFGRCIGVTHGELGLGPGP